MLQMSPPGEGQRVPGGTGVRSGMAVALSHGDAAGLGCALVPRGGVPVVTLGLARFVLLALLVLFVAYVTWLLRRNVDS